MAGRLAPFIELGVGFNPELTSRENVVLNGVLMGLGRREARRRLDSVLDFAELREFTDLKLKNYSSGMMVRLAFAVMVEADADIMLIDEVLAVGDAAFGQKCMDVFRAKRDAGRTLVLVTHDMATVQGFCDRAMLIHDGEDRVPRRPRGDGAALLPPELRGRRARVRPGRGRAIPDVNARIRRRVARGRGRRSASTTSSRASPFRFNAVVEARRDLERPVFGFHCFNADGGEVFGFHCGLETDDGQADRVAAGERVRIGGEIENRLLPGPVLRAVLDRRATARRATSRCTCSRLLDFVVFGTAHGSRGRLRRAPTSRRRSRAARSERRRSRHRAARRPRPVGAGRRLAALARSCST